MSGLSKWLLICLALSVDSCSLVLETNSLNEGCPERTKPCFGKCVSKDLPQYGCGRAGCIPCGLPHAKANCNAESVCGIAECVPPFADCDQDPTNGCEVNTYESLQYCGGCTNVEICPPAAGLPHVKTMGCGNRVCYVRQCEPGYLDCDQEPTNGCEYAVAVGVDGGTCP